MKQRDLLVWTPEMVANYWDYESQFAENYFSHLYGRPIVEELKPFLKTKCRILDYGCGPGYLLENFFQAGFDVAGMDSSAESRLAVAKRFEGKPEFLGVFSEDELEKSDLRFDAITVIEVIEHLYDPWLDGLLERLKQLLSPDGAIVFTTPNEEDLSKNYILSPDSNRIFHSWQHVRSWSKGGLEDYLLDKGFEVATCYATNFSTSPHARNKKKAGKWSPFKQFKRWKKGKKKSPHLLAIARPVTPRRA